MVISTKLHKNNKAMMYLTMFGLPMPLAITPLAPKVKLTQNQAYETQT